MSGQGKCEAGCGREATNLYVDKQGEPWELCTVHTPSTPIPQGVGA